MFTITCVSRHCPKEVVHSLAYNERRLFQSKHSITDRVAKFCINVLWNLAGQPSHFTLFHDVSCCRCHEIGETFKNNTFNNIYE
ncbi:hypothetical protein T09_11868 [Trichinella sp. T9]|nr:hypothetical protein T09_11868 [Trichinella sp. T9]